MGAFVQVVKQIFETLLSFRSALVKSRVSTTKRELVRVFFDLADFRNSLARFTADVENAKQNNNTGSLQNAIRELTSLHDILERIVARFYRITRSDVGRYLLELEGYRGGETLDTAFGLDAYILLEWTGTLRSYIHELERDDTLKTSHLDAHLTLKVLDERYFNFHDVIAERKAGQPMPWQPKEDRNTLAAILAESHALVELLDDLSDSYRTFLKSCLTLEDVL